MRGRLAFAVTAAVGLVALFGLPSGDLHPSSCELRAVWADDEANAKSPPALPPLSLDKGNLLRLDDTPSEPSAADRAAQAINGACFVCHENLKHEPLVTMHARAKLSCMECHGPSLEHRNDEDNVTPPDIMFSTAAIDAACRECHETHDVPAAEIVARWQDRRAGKSATAAAVCTDCHGRHRLPRRVVRWDKQTRAVLVGPARGTAPSENPDEGERNR